jgi:Arc/MetJ-type ribon-helix-helix transcriptional regulator
MQVQLSGKAAEIVKAKVAAGEYPNAAAFISDLVLRAEEFDQSKLGRLPSEVRLGLDEIKRGEVVEFDLDEIMDARATALLSEQVLAVDWNRPEEDEAWAHLQPSKNLHA